MRTGATYRWHDQVPRFQAVDGRTDFRDLGERFMSKHQVIIPPRWRAVFEGADLFVRATDADFERQDFDLRVLGNIRQRVLQNPHLVSPWNNPHRLHDSHRRFQRLSRSAFPMTTISEAPIAKADMMGLRKPKAAKGIPHAL